MKASVYIVVTVVLCSMLAAACAPGAAIPSITANTPQSESSTTIGPEVVEATPPQAPVETDNPSSIPSITVSMTHPAQPVTNQTQPPSVTQGASTTVPPYLDAVLRSLAANFNLKNEEVVILSIEPFNWPDAGLGCPLPGMSYAEVITPGFVVRVEARDITYVFHTDELESVVLCSEDGIPLLPDIPIPTGEKIMDGEPWVPVD